MPRALVSSQATCKSRPTFRGCHVEGNWEEGVVVMDDATVELVGCHVRDNKVTNMCDRLAACKMCTCINIYI